MPKISVCVPLSNMKNKAFFLERLINSLLIQTFRDFEVVMTEGGEMAENINRTIKKAKGEIVKLLFMDDYLAHKDSLKIISNNFSEGWMVTACEHDDGKRINPHFPLYTHEIHTGKNTIGSPSVLSFENKNPLFFDEKLTWLLDCDLYKRLFNRYGVPKLIYDINVVIGIHDGQMTNLISKKRKEEEFIYLKKKYA